MVRAVPGVPGPARPPARRAPPAPRARPVATPASCSTARPSVVDDYLEVRPEAAETLRRLAATGRLSVGPWMVLMDEFMVSGETIVRDLQLGLRARGRARRRDAGGLPARHVRPHRADAADPPAGRPRARGGVARRPVDGRRRPRSGGRRPTAQRVRAEYLYGSYSNGRDLPDDAKQLVARARELRARARRRPAFPAASMLLMNGTDHQMPQPWLGRVVAEANEIQDDYRFVVTSLAEYLARAADRRTDDGGGASCDPGRAPTCSWAWRRTASTCTRRARSRSGRSSAGRSRCRRCSLPADRYPDALLGDRVAASSC